MKSRTAIEFSERFNKRWLGYAAAAGAAGIGLACGTPAAKADIIYTSASSQVPVNGSLAVTIDGVAALEFTNSARAWTSGPYWRQSFRGKAGMDALAGLMVGAGGSAAKLPFGAFIGSYQKGAFNAGGGLMGSVAGQFGYRAFNRTWNGTHWQTSTRIERHPLSATARAGEWTLNGSGYLGFVFTAADDVNYYGWASLNITEVSSPSSAYYREVLTGYAYNNIPGAPITAGEGYTTPEPGTLGLLALGSLGLGFWRRKRTAVRG